MLDAQAQIEKHKKKGVLVDTNLLVLLLVGRVSKQRILEFKRTQNFEIDDFLVIESLVAWFGNLIATPYVLSQVSDLTDLAGSELARIRQLFKAMIEEHIQEFYDPSIRLVADPLFARLGLADAAIATICSRGILVLTDDVKLQLALQQRKVDALNFNHVRQLAWRFRT